MKAVFITTFPNDVTNVIAAWDCWQDVRATRIIFDEPEPHLKKQPSDAKRWRLKPINSREILYQADRSKPGVIFYIGSNGGRSPDIETLRSLRDIAPSINMCFDGGDKPWHDLLRKYRANECFDLQVTIDGRLDCPVDLVTTAPVNTSFFGGEDSEKDISCGISGNLMPGDKRSEIINPLVEEGLVEMRLREVVKDGYPEHVAFMRRCRMIINTSYCGSGKTHHVKQRVFETGFAGAALLEDAAAPTHHWIPSTHFFTYETSEHAGEIIKSLSTGEVAEKAGVLQEHIVDQQEPTEVSDEVLNEMRTCIHSMMPLILLSGPNLDAMSR